MMDGILLIRCILIIAQTCVIYSAVRVSFALLEKIDHSRTQVKNPNRIEMLAVAVILLSMFCLTHLIVFPNPDIQVICINIVVMSITMLATKYIKRIVLLNK